MFRNLGFHVLYPLLYNFSELLNCYQATDSDKARNDDVLHDSLAFLIFDEIFHNASFVAGGLYVNQGEFYEPKRECRTVLFGYEKVWHKIG